MDKDDLIKIATEGADKAMALAQLFIKSVNYANSGDMTTAQANLDQAQGHFDQFIADWGATTPPADPPA